MSKDYLNFMKISRVKGKNKDDVPIHANWNSSDESAKFSSLKMEEEHSTLSSSDTTPSRVWSELKSNSAILKSTSSSGSQTAEKATDMKSLIEKQRGSYVRRLQREIRWLEKVEKLLMEAQKKANNAKKKKKSLSPLKYQPLEINIRGNSKFDREKTKIPYVNKWIQAGGYDMNHCVCSCQQNEEIEKIDDRYFVSVPIQKKVEKKNAPVKPVLGKTIRKIDASVPANFDFDVRPGPRFDSRPNDSTPGISWFISLDKTKPWLQTRGPGDGSHSNVSRTVQPDGNEGATTVQLTLQDAVKYFKSDFILKSLARQQKIGIAARDRKHRTQMNYIYLTGLREQRFTNPEPETEALHKPRRRIFSHKEMREQTERLYRVLPEVVNEKDKIRRIETAKTHRLMAQIFKRKVQEKALQGKVSYSLTQRVQNSMWDM